MSYNVGPGFSSFGYIITTIHFFAYILQKDCNAIYLQFKKFSPLAITICRGRIQKKKKTIVLHHLFSISCIVSTK